MTNPDLRDGMRVEWDVAIPVEDGLVLPGEGRSPVLHTPVAQGWLRASHRALDPALSLPYRPYHPRDRQTVIFAGRTTLHAGPGQQPMLLLPIIPKDTP